MIFLKPISKGNFRLPLLVDREEIFFPMGIRCTLPESQWETIPYQRANHGEGPAMHDGGASKLDMKEALLSRAKVTGALSAKGRAARATKVGKVGRGLPYYNREYQTRTATLNSMRCLRGSQWRTYRQKCGQTRFRQFRRVAGRPI